MDVLELLDRIEDLPPDDLFTELVVNGLLVGLLVVFFGVYPAPVFDVTAVSVDALLNNVTASLDAAKTALAN